MKQVVLIFLLATVPLLAQVSKNDSWKPLDYFIGTWIGESSGKAGNGLGERTYQYIMKFEPKKEILKVRHTKTEEYTVLIRDAANLYCGSLT